MTDRESFFFCLLFSHSFKVPVMINCPELCPREECFTLSMLNNGALLLFAKAFRKSNSE